MKELVEGEFFVLSLKILSAILLSMVLIHFALIPTLELIRGPQKNLARARLMTNFLLMWRVVEHACVVRNAKHDWMQIVIDFLCRKHNE